jgi:hypothetical protein
MLEMHHMEITKFHTSAAVFSVVMKMKIVRKRIAVKHQKIRKLIRMTQLSMKG